MLLFELDHRQIDQQENGGEQRAPSPRLSRCDRQTGRHQQGAEVERIASVGIRTAGGQLLVLGQASGRPGAQREAGQRNRHAQGHQRAMGRENHANTATSRKPLGTRRRATGRRSASEKGSWPPVARRAAVENLAG